MKQEIIFVRITEDALEHHHFLRYVGFNSKDIYEATKIDEENYEIQSLHFKAEELIFNGKEES